MKTWKSKLFFLFLSILLFSILGLRFARMEKTTDAKYPIEFLTAEQFCKEKIKVQKFSTKQKTELLVLANSLEDCTRIELEAGTFIFDSSFTLASAKGIQLIGAGKKSTVLKFLNSGNGNGVDVSNINHFTIQNLSISDSAKNGLEIRNSENIVIDKIHVSWSNTSGSAMSLNGAYGIYPVNVKNIILQNSETYYASDAGLYVGQCINALVRNNIAKLNVMGLEIENTINAEVYGNLVENNTGGFLAYDLNKNTIVSRNIKVYKNIIRNNNNPNFASAGIVKTVPSGVGMVLTSVRDIEIFENEFAENHTADIGIINGLVSETPDFSKWPMNNWRAHDIYIHDNQFDGGNGTSLDGGKLNEKERPLGVLISLVLNAWNEFEKSKGEKAIPLSNIVYDGVDSGFTILQMTKFFGNEPGNHNSICIENNTKGKIRPSLMDLNLPALLANAEEPTTQSISNAVHANEVRIYSESSEEFGGAPTKGFSCKGFKATGLPIAFPDL